MKKSPKRTRETITYLHHNSLRRKTSRRRRRKSTHENTHTPTDRTLASRVYEEEKEINRNEEAFWVKNGQMVKCEEEKNEENGEREEIREVFDNYCLNLL